VSFNDYPGWYTDTFATIGAAWKNLSAWSLEHYPDKPFIMSEFGAGAIFEWTNSTKGSPPAAKWTQQGQADIVVANIKAGLVLQNVSGIAIWQLFDVKADPSDFHPGPGPEHQVCQACNYTTPYNASTPMNCSSISTKCFRPGGENHKGALDFWRREKAAFAAAKALYRYKAAPEP